MVIYRNLYKLSVPLCLYISLIADHELSNLFTAMGNPDQIKLIGDAAYIMPIILGILLILNLFGIFSYIKRKLGYDEYLSDSQQLYNKIHQKNSELLSTSPMETSSEDKSLKSFPDDSQQQKINN